MTADQSINEIYPKVKAPYNCQKKANFSNENSFLSLLKKEKLSQSSYKNAPILESLFKIEHVETYSFIKKGTLLKVFYYELYKVLIDIDICVEHPWQSAYMRKITEPVDV